MSPALCELFAYLDALNNRAPLAELKTHLGRCPVVCDDVVCTGSYNLSHSGEMNAENLLEIRSRGFADLCATFCESVHQRYSAGGAGAAPSASTGAPAPPR